MPWVCCAEAIVSVAEEKEAKPLLAILLAWLICISTVLLAFVVKMLWNAFQKLAGSSIPPEMRILDKWWS